MLERLVRRIEKHLRRCGVLRTFEDEAEPDGEGDPEGNLAASAVWGQAPPAGPQWVSRLAPLEPHALAYDKPLCASREGFTLHAATRAGALHPAGRETLLRYVLRPPVAQERVELRPDGLVCITLKKAYTDRTIAVDMDPVENLGAEEPRGHTRTQRAQAEVVALFVRRDDHFQGVAGPHALVVQARITSRAPRPDRGGGPDGGERCSAQ